jgi:hypothetical protein
VSEESEAHQGSERRNRVRMVVARSRERMEIHSLRV